MTSPPVSLMHSGGAAVPMSTSRFDRDNFLRALNVPPENRTLADLQLIYFGLHELDALQTCRDSILRQLSKFVRCEKHQVNEILFRTGELIKCWYILLSGSVFINGSLYLPGACFGKRSGGNSRRQSECFVLESSEMIVIDYPEARHTDSQEKLLNQMQSTYRNSGRDLYQKCNRGSHSSDTSSAYSGSDTMTSVHSSSLEQDEVDLSGLVESVVDSDEEDLAESIDSLTVRDTVRDCLEKDPTDRTDDDIEILLEFTKNLKAFTQLTHSVRRALCSVMVFAVVDKAGTIVMNDGEELDSWSVLINGQVEIQSANGDVVELQIGDSFGILPTMDKLYHNGVMRTKCDDCQFVCITQTDYYRIQHQNEENIRKHIIADKCVLVTELRNHTYELNYVKRVPIIIRGTPRQLILQLVNEFTLYDATYVEDFLLTYRTFTSGPLVANKVLQWVLKAIENATAPSSATHSPATEETSVDSDGDNLSLNDDAVITADELIPGEKSPINVTDRATSILLLWANNHFGDFEGNPKMMQVLEKFEEYLAEANKIDELRFLHITFLTKAKKRNITIRRSARDEPLNFQIIGGNSSAIHTSNEVTGNTKGNSATGGHAHYGIYVLQVNTGTKPAELGLKRGDKIMEVNGQPFDYLAIDKAMEILTGTTHLSITVKSNLIGFKETLHLYGQQKSGNTTAIGSGRRRIIAELAKLNDPRTAFFQNNRHSSYDPTGKMAQSDENTIILCEQDQTDCAPAVSSPVLSKHAALLKKHSQDNMLAANTPLTGGSKDSSSCTNPSSGNGFMTLGPKSRLQKALQKIYFLPKTLQHQIMPGNSAANIDQADDLFDVPTSNQLHNNNSTCKNANGGLVHSHSNPDLSVSEPSTGSQSSDVLHTNDDTKLYIKNHMTQPLMIDYPEHVLKVYKSDQTCKYLLVHKETTAHEVVMLALREFGIHDSSSKYSLCEVTVCEGGMVKQRRLPDQLQNLAERIGLASRYYLKVNGSTDTLVTDEVVQDLERENSVYFLQLNANEVATQLTNHDFIIFQQVEPTEYIYDLFHLEQGQSTEQLLSFGDLVNQEMFWVVTEVCQEHNLVRRMKIIKQFIKIARHCKECRNFNSMFAIISGLGHASVSRLRSTWDKLPSKYQRLFNDLQDLMDPSRNMSKYRQLVNSELLQHHSIIPFYPVVKKDLTFIHLGNDTRIEDLINFEKLRMVAKEIRNLKKMSSSPRYELQIADSGIVAISSSTSLNSNNSVLQKRRKKSSAAPNPKKMFEESQMVRRVKAYLTNMLSLIITDEDKLHQLSLECEPMQSLGSAPGSANNSAPNSGLQIRKRHPSPTLSTTSSTSSTSENNKRLMSSGGNGPPKFGAASPQAVKKILSLAETHKTRPHQPARYHPTAAPPSALMSSSVSESGRKVCYPPTCSSQTASPIAVHRRMGSSSSAGSAPAYTTSAVGASELNSWSGSYSSGSGNSINVIPSLMQPAHLLSAGTRIHERSHSDTPLILPAVDLSMESSSVTSLSNLPPPPVNKTKGQAPPIPSQMSAGNAVTGMYHVASSIVHNPPAPPGPPPRRHSAMQQQSVNPMRDPNATRHGSLQTNVLSATPPLPAGSAPHPRRTPPAYNVAAQFARMYRLNRAHSHEGVISPANAYGPTGKQMRSTSTSGPSVGCGPPMAMMGQYGGRGGLHIHLPETNIDDHLVMDGEMNNGSDDEDDAQVSAV